MGIKAELPRRIASEARLSSAPYQYQSATPCAASIGMPIDTPPSAYADGTAAKIDAAARFGLARQRLIANAMKPRLESAQRGRKKRRSSAAAPLR